MSTRTNKLVDQRFRRTAACSKYQKIIKEKSLSIPTFDDSPIDGKLLTADYVRENGIDKPLLIKDGKKDLHMRMLPPSATLAELSHILGVDTPIKVIDVGCQEELDGWTIGEYASFFEGRGREHKVLNLISLEISSGPLATKIQGPSFVRQIDWIDAFWPSARRARGDYPQVQKYLLAGMQGAYTDFHLDFGGTSVWYHVLWGEKIFYFVRPTGANLRMFEQWTKDSLQSNQFLGDLLPPGECFKIHLRAGDTMIIPGGWIHAVFTPEDSLVFGGNFIHSSCISRQLQVYGIENRTHVGKKYRFPYFKQLMWLGLTSLLPMARPGGSAEGDSRDNYVDDPLYDLFLALDQPKVLEQWVYLVKMCDLWLSCTDLTSDDRYVLSTASTEAGCARPIDVVTEWFSILRTKTSAMDPHLAICPKDTLDRIGMITLNTKEFLTSLCDDATLDRDCIQPALAQPSCDINSEPEVEEALVDNQSSINETIVVKSEATVALTPVPKKESETAPGSGRGSGLRLKFTIGGDNKTTVAATTTDDSRQNNSPPNAALSIDVNSAENAESLFGSDDEEDEEPTVVANEPSSDPSGAPVKKTFKFHLKNSEGFVSTLPEEKTNLAIKVPRTVKKTERIKEDTLGKERYGTRGLKLSAKFLENAADFVDDEYDEKNDEAVHGLENGVASGHTTVEARATTPGSSEDAPVVAPPETVPPQSTGAKRRRPADDDFIFDVNDAADEEEYHVSDDGGGNDDDDWVAEEVESEEEYGEIEANAKRRKVSSGVAKVARTASPPPPPPQAAAGMKLSLVGSGQNTVKPMGKLKAPGGIGMTKSGGTIRQQLMKKLGSKYK